MGTTGLAKKCIKKICFLKCNFAELSARGGCVSRQMELQDLPDNFQVPLATEDACELSVISISEQLMHVFIIWIPIHLKDYLCFS